MQILWFDLFNNLVMNWYVYGSEINAEKLYNLKSKQKIYWHGRDPLVFI